MCHIIKGDVVTMAAYIHHDTGENQNNIIQSVVTTCYEMLIRPIKEYSFPLINLESFIQKYTHTISSSQRLNVPQETQLEYYTQEDEENNFNAENTRNTSHYYQEDAHEKPYHIVKPKVTHFQPHKRKTLRISRKRRRCCSVYMYTEVTSLQYLHKTNNRYTCI